MVGGWEFTKTLQTTDKQIAIPLALQFASITKQVFNNLKKDMPDPEREKLLQLLRGQKQKQTFIRRMWIALRYAETRFKKAVNRPTKFP